MKNYTLAKEKMGVRMMLAGRIANRNKMEMDCRKVMRVAIASSVRMRKKRRSATTMPNSWRQMKMCSPLRLS